MKNRVLRMAQEGMTLVYNPKDSSSFSGKHFYFRYGPDKHGVPTVTGRDLSEHNDSTREYVKNFEPNHQIIELGPGLGEFLPALRSAGLRRKPIAIDFVDYVLLERMLTEIKPRVGNPEHRRELQGLIDRARFYQNEENVDLRNQSFQEALKDSSLYNSADVVVDNCGPNIWNKMVQVKGRKMKIRTAEKNLLRESGLLISGQGEPTYRLSEGELIRI